MKTKEIKKQLEMMYNFYEADAQLCAMADMNYDWGMRIEQGYQIIAQRLGVSVDEVRSVDECLNNEA
jgi:hypothetical protein